MSQDIIDIAALGETTKFVFTNAVEDTYEFEFDMQDADIAEGYFLAVSKMQREHLALPKDVDVIEDIRNFCKVVRDFFDEIFGEGAGQKLLPKDNRRHVVNAYAAFLEFVERQNSALKTFVDNRAATIVGGITKSPQQPQDHLLPLKRGRKPRQKNSEDDV